MNSLYKVIDFVWTVIYRIPAVSMVTVLLLYTPLKERDYKKEHFMEFEVTDEMVSKWNENLPKLIEHAKSFDKADIIPFWSCRAQQEGIGKECFSQWYPSPFTVNRITYHCTEQWMMAEKARLFGDNETLDKILMETIPRKIKDLGRTVKGFDVEEWKKYRFEIVTEGNLHKFSQNKNLSDYLLSTGDKIIVEASPFDRIWGIGIGDDNEFVDKPRNWPGLNLLGFAIMTARDELRNTNGKD